jgi:two-component sensor histidine kinase
VQDLVLLTLLGWVCGIAILCLLVARIARSHARRVSRRLLFAEEEERRRLALALHDGPQQAMAAIALMLDTAAAILDDGDIAPAREIVAQAAQRDREVLRSLRELQFALEPVTLRDQGFSAACRELADQLERSHGLRITVDARPADSAGPSTQLGLYRIAQEALANAVKHARARHVEVTVRRPQAGVLVLEVRDDGCGARTEDLARGGRHRGVGAMRSRAAAISAVLTIDGTPNGTCVTVCVDESHSETEAPTPLEDAGRLADELAGQRQAYDRVLAQLRAHAFTLELGPGGTLIPVGASTHRILARVPGGQSALDDLGAAVAPDERPRLDAAIRRLAAGEAIDLTLRSARGGHHVRWLQLHAEPRPLTDGRRLVDGVIADVTERGAPLADAPVAA